MTNLYVMSCNFMSWYCTGDDMPWLLRSVCPGGHQIRTIEYGKILVMYISIGLWGILWASTWGIYNKVMYCMCCTCFDQYARTRPHASAMLPNLEWAFCHSAEICYYIVRNFRNCKLVCNRIIKCNLMIRLQTILVLALYVFDILVKNI